MYSVERLYNAPIISSVSCTEGSLSFTTFNNFKTSSQYGGTYAVETAPRQTRFGGATTMAIPLAPAGKDVDYRTSAVEFNFRPHWRPKEITVDLILEADECSDGCTLSVTNALDETSTASFTCPSR